MTETRTFHIGDILSVMTDRLVSPNHVGGVYTLLDWMTDSSSMTHQLPRLARECGPSLRSQFPDLAAVEVPDDLEGEQPVMSWLAKQAAQYGETREVARLDPADHTYIDPITEIRMVAPHLTIIGVQYDPDGTP